MSELPTLTHTAPRWHQRQAAERARLNRLIHRISAVVYFEDEPDKEYILVTASSSLEELVRAVRREYSLPPTARILVCAPGKKADPHRGRSFASAIEGRTGWGCTTDMEIHVRGRPAGARRHG